MSASARCAAVAAPTSAAAMAADAAAAAATAAASFDCGAAALPLVPLAAAPEPAMDVASDPDAAALASAKPFGKLMLYFSFIACSFASADIPAGSESRGGAEAAGGAAPHAELEATLGLLAEPVVERVILRPDSAAEGAATRDDVECDLHVLLPPLIWLHAAFSSVTARPAASPKDAQAKRSAGILAGAAALLLAPRRRVVT